LSIAIQAETERFDDPEIRQFISRDIRLLLSQEQSLKLAEIYNAASRSAKSFMQEVIRDIDPSALDQVSKGAQK